MPASDIVIKGAREHNLRNIDLVLPRNQLICLTGVSGSGKSSLAFDTLFAEGQRRYVESLSSFARHFLQQMPKPDVDLISGLSPSISISQKSSSNNPRSTVGTITEIYDFLRVLFARAGTGYCPKCNIPISAQSRDQIVGRISQIPDGTPFAILAPLIRGQKGEHRDLFNDLLKQGFIRVRVNGKIQALSDTIRLERQQRHYIEVVIDRLVAKPNLRPRISEAVELAMKVGSGTLMVAMEEDSPGDRPRSSDEDMVADAGLSSEIASDNDSMASGPSSATRELTFSADYACGQCGTSFLPPSPQLFSFNSPQGMCPNCTGLGEIFSFIPERLIPNPALSIKQGCVELLGKWSDFGRWRRHIYQGVADTLERIEALPEGFLLETAWAELGPRWQHVWLFGTDDLHVTYTWRGGNSPMKYGGQFAGIIAELMERYKNLKLATKQAQFEAYMDQIPCASCQGQRLNSVARFYRLHTQHGTFSERPELSLPEVCDLSIDRASEFFSGLQLDDTRQLIAEQPLKEVRQRLGFLLNVGLEYLSLGRTAPTLSGGETQRIRLAGQIGAGLVGVLYILDEPSIGLHARDNDRLIETLHRLRDLGNTVVVVEHDEDTMRAADHMIDFGPGPGVHGGNVVVEGTPQDVMESETSLTGAYLSGRKQIAVPLHRRPVDPQRMLRIVGARQNNLKNITAEIPIGLFVCITGVSGSGKSSLVNDILIEALNVQLNHGTGEPGAFDRLEGAQFLDKMIAIDQSPIGRTPRSNPGTYVKLFDEIRKLYSQMPESKRRGFAPGRFSFNVAGGRCEACEGNGANKLEMDFLADIWVTCPVCQGARFSRETLQVKFRDRSISEVLEMSVEEALNFFENVPKIREKLQTLHSVGLDYLKIGQPSPTLSGGEAQRIKLARELVKRSTGQTLYLLDEPTTGLHFADIHLLLKVLHQFADMGNTVVVVEHNLDVIKTADWIIDIGPEGGLNGGEVVVSGTPETVAACDRSYTGRALKKILSPTSNVAKSAKSSTKSKKKRVIEQAKEIVVQGAQQHNLKNVDITVPRDQMNVFCGPSGSGKSSMAMDTIYAEGQRRYVESLSSYARQFVNQMDKPKVDHIDGLSPAIAIEQKNFGSTSRSTVGTITEIYDYFRILMARLGQPYCPDCDVPIGTQTSDQIVEKILQRHADQKIIITAPIDLEPSQDIAELWAELQGRGFVRVRVDGKIYNLADAPTLARRAKHEVEIVIDRLDVKSSIQSRLSDSVETALATGKGILVVLVALEKTEMEHWPQTRYSQFLACDQCGRGFDALTPNHFSFNSQLGWCPDCQGLGTRTGTSPALLFKNMETSLREGGLRLWPNLNDEFSRRMLDTLCQAVGINADSPISQLDSRQRRLLFYGTGTRWFEIRDAQNRLEFSFQFKGLYPVLEEASNLSPSLRMKLHALVGEVECGSCGGSRLRDHAAAVRLRNMTLDAYCRLPLGLLLETVNAWKLNQRDAKIAGELVKEIRNRVQFLNDVGLEYLSLSRGSATLSNGESQRIRLASQLGSGLVGVLYVLDEPTIGLHPRDNRRLLGALHRLRDLGNTLIVVEHDREVIENCDHVFDFGPKAGDGGGQVVADSKPKDLGKQRESVTGPYITGRKAIPIPINRRPGLWPRPAELADTLASALPPATTSGKKPTSKSKRKTTEEAPPVVQANQVLAVFGARHNNLQNVDIEIPLQTLSVVTGPSGCGKSSLVNDVLYNSLARRLHNASTTPGAHRKITGLEHINKVIRVDQQAIGTTPASNPATYTGVFDLIRQLFAELPDAKVRGYTARRFSFNVAGGRCEACQGNGQICIEMHFLPDVWVECQSCHGKRYTEDTLAVRYRGRSINDVLEMTCSDALSLFDNISKIKRILQTLCDVGLDYVKLGQSAPTLSGGEAQRVKLAAELARPDTGRTLYLLDEPTTGLHFDDLAKLLVVLQRLVDLGNTVLLIEHNLDIIKAADWVIDMGPEAGHGGGRVVTAGTPEQVVAYAALARSAASKKSDTTWPRSWTGEALESVLQAGPYEKRLDYVPPSETAPLEVELAELSQQAKMPWEENGRRWHTQDRVAHDGSTAEWDGKILAEVIDRLEQHAGFHPTLWTNRSIVEVMGAQHTKSSDNWFLHALTGERWMLRLKLRVRRGTFKAPDLLQQIPLKTANELDDLPVYGNQPRIKVTQQRGFQEVEMRLHRWAEINHDGFWKFLDQAITGYFGPAKPTQPVNLEAESPWAKLGKTWHRLPKGFPPNQPPAWPIAMVDTWEQLLQSLSSSMQWDWQQPQFASATLSGQSNWLFQAETKRPEAMVLHCRISSSAVSRKLLESLKVDYRWETDESETEILVMPVVRNEVLKSAACRQLFESIIAAAQME